LPTFPTVSGPSPASVDTPVATAVITPAYGVIGSLLTLNGRASYSPDGADLTYAWSFVELPIGSQIRGTGFTLIDPDGSEVSFSPDVVGEYLIQLIVSNGVYFSEPFFLTTSIRATLVPTGRGIVPDGKFIWSYLRDVWQDVEGREVFDTFWSALIQIVGGELLKTWQVDYNKSIRDIQDFFQRKWLSYEPKLDLTGNTTLYLGNFAQGTSGISSPTNLPAQAILLPDNKTLVVVDGYVSPTLTGQTVSILSSLNPANIAAYKVLSAGRFPDSFVLSPSFSYSADQITATAQFSFLAGSSNWTQLDASTLTVGEWIFYPSGVNAGFYQIVSLSGTAVGVGSPPPSASDATFASVCNAVNLLLPQSTSSLTDAIALPLDSASLPVFEEDLVGRVLVFGGRDYINAYGNAAHESGSQAYTILRSALDTFTQVPVAVISTDQSVVPAMLTQQNWRLANTLVSADQDLEDLGVSAGDLIIFLVTQAGSSNAVQVQGQVIGVDRYKLAFYFSTDTTQAGVAVQETLLQALLTAFPQANPAAFTSIFNSGAWQKQYYNAPLTGATQILIGTSSFFISARTIVRNRLVKVDSTLRSVPTLQEFITQPDIVEQDGNIFMSRAGQLFQLARVPIQLVENSDYVVDGQVAFEGELTFQTGLSYLHLEGVDFIDRNISAGDEFIVQSPLSIAGTYPIAAIVDQDNIRLALPIPEDVLNPMTLAQCQILRKRTSQYIRFVPGTFSPSVYAPNRLWGETSYFDNGDAIEGNFGILVALTQADLATYTQSLNYRQAVAGLMYAYTQGPMLDSIRTGAQILLGLPFAEHVGIITSINTSYRLNSIGEAIQGQILVEDTDAAGKLQGLQRIYIFPIDPNAPDLSGVDTNPATGNPYAVGDTVELFAPLCLGVRVEDYLTNVVPPGSAQNLLQQYHSATIYIEDTIFTPAEIELVSDFLTQITPSYVAIHMAIEQGLMDAVSVGDIASPAIDFKFYDSALFATTPLMLDPKYPSGSPVIQMGEAVYWLRRSGRDAAPAAGTPSNFHPIIDFPGTLPGPANLFGPGVPGNPPGGVLSPRADTYGITEVFEAPLTQGGDFIWLMSGKNQGLYQISGSNLSDTSLEVTGSNAPAAFEGETGVHYAILRPVTPQLMTGLSASFTSFSEVVQLSGGGLRTAGVGVGDWLTIQTFGYLTRTRYTITSVQQSGDSWDIVTVSPLPNATISGISVGIWRPYLLGNPCAQTFTLNVTAGVFTVDSGVYGLLDIGDEFQIQNAALQRLTVIYPGLPGEVYGTSKVLQNVTLGPVTALLCKKGRPAGPVAMDQVSSRLLPQEEFDVSLVESSSLATCTNSSANVALATSAGSVNPQTLLVRPGDLLELSGGSAGSLDLGYGAGIYPISSVSSGYVTIVHTLSANETLPWTITRTQRP
jgi:hypothetical protein